MNRTDVSTTEMCVENLPQLSLYFVRLAHQRPCTTAVRMCCVPHLFTQTLNLKSQNTEICPGMVGPVDDGMYYCLGKEHGYCDRRSGTCFCNVGYQGISCQDCSSTHYEQGGLCYPKLVRPIHSAPFPCSAVVGIRFCSFYPCNFRPFSGG